MLVNVMCPCKIEIKPGDKVKLLHVRSMFGRYKPEVITTIKRIVESESVTYAVFNGGYAYRPLRTYGETWEKCYND